MVDLDIIKPVRKLTDWVNGLVVVEKPNGKLRICLDPRTLNKTIKHGHLHSQCRRNFLPNIRGILFFKTRRQLKLLAN